MKRRETGTTKIVINSCYGGFGLSEKAVRRYAELKGLPFYPEKDKKFSILSTYWTCPPEDRKEWYSLERKPWGKLSDKEREYRNSFYTNNTISPRELDRDDPILVQVVEELGSKEASGTYAKLEVVELPKGTRYRITEYDGFEGVETDDSWSDWETA